MTKTRSGGALAASIVIHGALVALVIAVATSGSASDERPKAGVIGSAEDGRGSGVGGAITPPPSGPSLNESDARRYVGRYLRPASSTVDTIEVGLVNDGEVEPHWALILDDGSGPLQKLVPISRDTFALQLAPRQHVVFRRNADSVTAVSVRRGRDTSWAQRTP